MAKVIWSPSSLDDIDSIAKYISKDSVYHASLFIDRLFEATNRLKQLPLSGRIIPESSCTTPVLILLNSVILKNSKVELKTRSALE